MNGLLRICRPSVGLGLIVAGLLVVPGWGPARAAEEAAATAASASAETGPYRKLAPWTLKTVETDASPAQAVARHDIVELTAVDPNYDWAKDVAFRRDVWHLEFKFKPLRRIMVDIPQDSGKMQRKAIWYLTYSVTNTGKILHPVAEENGVYKVEETQGPIHFVPEFLLYAPEFNKTYPDRVIPVALGPIRLREDAHREFLSTVEMVRDIAPGQTLWGVAMWEDLDPAIDRFSILVTGLTNAYQWQDQPGAFQPGSPVGTGRTRTRQTLQLNFWWPGDARNRGEEQIRYGRPGEVDYAWVYR